MTQPSQLDDYQLCGLPGPDGLPCGCFKGHEPLDYPSWPGQEHMSIQQYVIWCEQSAKVEEAE